MANVLITGAAGFIGSSFAKRLSKLGHNLVLIDNFKYGNQDNFSDAPDLLKSMNVIDIRSSETYPLYRKIDAVYHFAGISSLPECQAHPIETFSVNSAGTANVFEFSRLNNVKKIVLASTAAVYENSLDNLNSELELVDPHLLYSLSKKHAEDVAKSFAKAYGMEYVICRFFNVYGPHQDFRRPNPPFTSYLVKELLAGNVPTIFNVSEDKRDYIYIDDLMIYLEILLDKSFEALPRIFNLASGFSYSPLEIFRKLCEVAGFKEDYQVGVADQFWSKYSVLSEGFPISETIIRNEIHKNAISNTENVKKFLSEHSPTSLEDGLRSIVEFQRKSIQ